MTTGTTAPAFVSLLSWAAGVIDAVGRFQLRWRHSNGAQRVSGARVYAYISPEVGRRLVDTVGGEYHHSRRRWWLPADAQEKALSKVIPFLVVKNDEAQAVLAYRLSGTRPAFGERISDGIHALRERLAHRGGAA